MNSTKSVMEPMNSSRNKLHSKKKLLFSTNAKRNLSEAFLTPSLIHEVRFHFEPQLYLEPSLQITCVKH